MRDGQTEKIIIRDGVRYAAQRQGGVTRRPALSQDRLKKAARAGKQATGQYRAVRERVRVR